MFFNFSDHLKGFGISANSVGMLWCVFNVVSLVVRPFVSPYSHSQNAFKLLAVAAAGIVVCMGSYAFTENLPGLVVLRCFHGLCFVLLLTFLMAMIVHVISEVKAAKRIAL